MSNLISAIFTAINFNPNVDAIKAKIEETEKSDFPPELKNAIISEYKKRIEGSISKEEMVKILNSAISSVTVEKKIKSSDKNGCRTYINGVRVKKDGTPWGRNPNSNNKNFGKVIKNNNNKSKTVILNALSEKNMSVKEITEKVKSFNIITVYNSLADLEQENKVVSKTIKHPKIGRRMKVYSAV